MARRRKSYDDIKRQMNRIISEDERRNGGEWSSRANRAVTAGNRYLNNIAEKRGVKKELRTRNSNPYTAVFINTSRKYSRSTYMGNTKG